MLVLDWCSFRLLALPVVTLSLLLLLVLMLLLLLFLMLLLLMLPLLVVVMMRVVLLPKVLHKHILVGSYACICRQGRVVPPFNVTHFSLCDTFVY